MTDATLRRPGTDEPRPAGEHRPTNGPEKERLPIPGGTTAPAVPEKAEPEEAEPGPAATRDQTPEPTSPGVVSAALHHPRTSVFVVAGLVLNVSAALTVLTGALAPVAIVLAGLGVLSSGLGLAATRKPHITGRVTALLSIVLGLAVAVVAGAALVGGIDWLDHPDQPARLRHWLHVHLPLI